MEELYLLYLVLAMMALKRSNVVYSQEHAKTANGIKDMTKGSSALTSYHVKTEKGSTVTVSEAKADTKKTNLIVPYIELSIHI